MRRTNVQKLEGIKTFLQHASATKRSNESRTNMNKHKPKALKVKTVNANKAGNESVKNT